VTDSTLSITNTAGFTAAPILNAPFEVVDKFRSWKFKAEWGAADRGPHSWFGSFVVHGMDQDFKSGGNVKRTIWGATWRYFWQRTYGFEAYYRKDSKYEYTGPGGSTRKVLLKPSYGLTGLWNPAMNFSTHFNWIPKIQNTVFEDQSALYQGSGKAYNVGFEYAF
jgi:hypothetical protein